MKSVVDCLKERGLIEAITNDALAELCKKPLKAYVGFDPTADSLHLGNFVGIMVLAWLQRYGHTPVVILGGATARIGDPSGKSQERPLLDQATIASNVSGIRKHFEKILSFQDPKTAPLILNNDDWYMGYALIDFLRDIGKHFRVNVMLGKEMVRNRIESEEGISFTEFSYQILQSYDFYYLQEHYGVCLQMGGSDQWGNITAGIELIRKLTGKPSYGLTWPLLVRSDGKKFGKTEEGAVWLSADKTSPYQFYQYFMRVPDADVIMMMRMLTFMDLSEIASYEKEMSQSTYVPNTAQKRLAEEVTRIVHGEEGLTKALRVTESVSPGAKASLDAERLQEVAADMPNVSLAKDEVVGQKFVDVAVKSGLMTSKAETIRLINNGGAYLNDAKVESPDLRISSEHLIGDIYLLLGAGKKKKMLVTVLYLT